MTDTSRINPEDIETVDDAPSVRLDRQADEILARDEMRSLGVRPIRQALREDAAAARNWGRTRALQLRDTVEQEPLRATVYALGIGVLIGFATWIAAHTTRTMKKKGQAQ